MTVSVTGRENIDPKQSYIIAANHQSQYDIFAIYGWLPIDFRWVMKIELRKVPIFGAYSEHAGHICIDRSNPLKAMQSINRAKEKLAAGTSIFFFPEGTRSRDGELLPFKMGAFRLALDMQLPILPITISGTRDILPSGTLKLFPGHVRIIVHKPIDIREFNDQTIVQLAHRTRFAIQNGLTEDKVAHS
jgi:1-acyl-sn-glycerol-3-phosphate acyltransferase